MKILQLAHHAFPCVGGTEEMVSRLSVELAKRGHEVTIRCLDRCAKSGRKLPTVEEIKGVRIEREPFLDLRFYKVAWGILRDAEKFDLVHVHGIGFFSDFALWRQNAHRRPVVVSSHGLIFHTPAISGIKKWYFERVQTELLRHATVVAVSPVDSERLKTIGVPSERVDNAVDLDAFMLGKKEWGRFVFVGRLSSNKRVELLLRVFSLVKKEVGDAELEIVGPDWEGLQRGLEQKARALGVNSSVRFAGEVSNAEKARVLSKSGFFVSASRHEGFGLSLVEAMASGCVPLVQALPAFEYIAQKSDASALVDYADAASAARVWIEWATKKPAVLERYSTMNLARARNFGWDAHVERVLAVYGRALGSPANPNP